MKSALLLDSLEQISEEQRFTAISEPDFDLEAVEVPEEGPMTFEFDLEVRPEFDLPQWKGLKLNRPVREFTDADIDEQLEQMLARYGQLVPFEGEAAEGDYISANITSSTTVSNSHRESEDVHANSADAQLPRRQARRLRQADEGREGGRHSHSRSHAQQRRAERRLARQESELVFEVLEVKKLKLPELTEEFLEETGQLRAPKTSSATRSQGISSGSWSTSNSSIARTQISPLLTESADWELPQGAAATPEQPRTGTGRHGTAPQWLQRRRDSCPRKPIAAEQRALARQQPSKNTSFSSESPRKKRSTSRRVITIRKSS